MRLRDVLEARGAHHYDEYGPKVHKRVRKPKVVKEKVPKVAKTPKPKAPPPKVNKIAAIKTGVKNNAIEKFMKYTRKHHPIIHHIAKAYIKQKNDKKKAELEENEVAANCVGNGEIAAIGVGPQGAPIVRKKKKLRDVVRRKEPLE